MHSRLTPRHLLAARPTDPFVRWRVDPEETLAVAVDGDHVGWTRRSESGTELWGTALGGDPARVARLIERLDAVAALDGVTVPDRAFTALPARLTSPSPGHWSPWFIEPEHVPRDPSAAVDLDPHDPRIDVVLAHSWSAEAFAGDPRVHRWAGVVEGDRVLAVAAERRRSNGAAHLVSVCTIPEVRGRGLAGRACLRLMQRACADGVPVIYLEMYAANESGRRTYGKLGFSEAGTYRSGLLHPDRS
ncbi:MAG: GNAT family N-acetyltransferase [Actinobacteria bacterium]|nr:GNAT family N-acetyltransferase [Actinomycetota bacterium]